MHTRSDSPPADLPHGGVDARGAARYAGSVFHFRRGLCVPVVVVASSGAAFAAAAPAEPAAASSSRAAAGAPVSPAAPAALPEAAAREAAAAPAAGQHLHVFFSGHSLLDDPLPDWIESIAASQGDALSWQEQIVLGSPIRARTRGKEPDASGFAGYQLGRNKAGGTIDVLGELAHPGALAPGEKYDRLVITERTDLLGAIQWEDTIGLLRDYHDRVVRENPRASSLLYEVWPEIDARDPAAWVSYVQGELFVWECVAARVNYTLASEGRADRVGVIPAGLALSELMQRALAGSVPGVSGAPAQRVAAIFKDDVHLMPLAIYLISAVQYAALFGRSPVGAMSPPEVNAAAVPLLQQLAWDTVSGYRARAERPPTLAECDTRVATELCPAYEVFQGKPDEVDQCKSWSTSESPFAGGHPTRIRRRVYLAWGAGLAFVAFIGWSYRRHRRRVALDAGS